MNIPKHLHTECFAFALATMPTEVIADRSAERQRRRERIARSKGRRA